MGQSTRVTISIPQDMLDQMQAAVESGRYASVSEVMREGFRLWQRQELLYHEDVKRLRKLWDEGMASGIADEMDDGWAERFKAEARARRAKQDAAE